MVVVVTAAVLDSTTPNSRSRQTIIEIARDISGRGGRDGSRSRRHIANGAGGGRGDAARGGCGYVSNRVHIPTKDRYLLATTGTAAKRIGLQGNGVLVAPNRIKTAPVPGVTQNPLFGALRVSDPSPPIVKEESVAGRNKVNPKTIYCAEKSASTYCPPDIKKPLMSRKNAAASARSLTRTASSPSNPM